MSPKPNKTAKALSEDMLPLTIRASLEARIGDADENGCRPWKGRVGNSSLYPVMTTNVAGENKEVTATRIAYVLRHGPLQEGELVRHTCDNQICCNGEHLVKGFPKDNTADMFNRGRANSRMSGMQFSQDQIAAIRSDQRPQHVIAKDYGCHQGTISRIKVGRKK